MLEESETCLLDTRSDSQQTMVLQQRSLLASKTSSNVLALLLCEHDAVEALVQDVIVVERARILRQRVQLPPKSAEGPAVDAVAVRSAQDIGPCLVDGSVDHVRGGVE